MYNILKERMRMKKYKFCKEKLKTISISMLALGVFFAGSAFANENSENLNVRLSEDYLQWSELSDKEKKKFYYAISLYIRCN